MPDEAWDARRRAALLPDVRLFAGLPPPAIADLASRLREAEDRILDLQTEDVESRIARTLLRLASSSTPKNASAAARVSRFAP